MLYGALPVRNPTAQISTAPGSVLRDGDYEGDAHRHGLRAARNARRIGGVKGASSYVGIIESPVIAADIQGLVRTAEGYAPAILRANLSGAAPDNGQNPNARKHPNMFRAMLEMVRENPASFEGLEKTHPKEAAKIARMLNL